MCIPIVYQCVHCTVNMYTYTHILQIYEWCQFMFFSGKTTKDCSLVASYQSSSVAPSCKSVNQLDKQDIKLLGQEYKRLYPNWRLRLYELPTSASLKEKDILKDPCTQRKIEYTTSTTCTKRGSANSFVSLKQSSTKNPVVGQIITIFDHSFLGECRTFAKICVFDQVQSESGFWVIAGVQSSQEPQINCCFIQDVWCIACCIRSQ